MRTSRLMPMLVAAPWFFVAPAYAGVAAGDTEVGIFANISSDNENDTSSFTMGGTFGHFFTDSFELKGTAAVNTTSDADGNSTGLMNFGVGGDLALGGADKQFVPYVGAGLNLTGLFLPTGDTGSGVTLDLHGGVKFFMTERAALDLQVRQTSGTVTVSTAFGDYDADINTTEFVFGINVYM